MEQVYIIAEIGQAHDGSLGIAHSFIDALAGTGIDAIKFQTHIAEAESSPFEPFRVKFSYSDKSRYDYWKRMEFTIDEWREIKTHCETSGVDFISTPASLEAVNLLEELEVKKYKVGSGDVGNWLLLEKIARTGKEIILSSGLSTYKEIENAIDKIRNHGNKISLLQCTTKYPTEAKDIGLNNILEFKKRFDLPVGFSDHSGTIYPSFAAVSLGATILEFHVAFDKRMFGPDSSSSLIISEVETLVEGVRFIESSIHNEIDKNNIENFDELRRIFGKSLAVNKDKKQGEILYFDDLESKKPSGYGIDVRDFEEVIGKKLRKDLSKWSFIKSKDLL